MDKGAHFYHCDFQVHTPRDLQWHANVIQANDVVIGKAKVGENGRQIDVNIYRTLIRRLIDNGVYLYPDSPTIEIRDNGVHV